MVEVDDKKKRKPGRGSRNRDDNPNHFADLDLVYEKKKTFLELNHEDPDTYLNPPAWVTYFDAMKPHYEEWAKLIKEPFKGVKAHWGALPFRVHQLFDTMVAAARDNEPKLFLLAGGVLIHYVGDACQPLHASYMSQGDPAKVIPRPKSPGMRLQAHDVHGGYEDNMIEYGESEKQLSSKLATRINSLKHEEIPAIESGFDASKAVIDLIKKTQDDIAPHDIVAKWVKMLKLKKEERDPEMWDEFGDRTITVMARGTRYLAALWQAAWTLGGGDGTIGAGPEIDEDDIRKLYENPTIAPSIPLDHYPSDHDSDWSTIKHANDGEAAAHTAAKHHKAAAATNKTKSKKKTPKRGKKK
jgi:hypothetical protein